jgi:hypothetical protein
MFCIACGNQLPLNAKFCSGCGSPIDETVETKSQGVNVDDLITSHLGLLGSYGNSSSDREIIEQALINLIDEISTRTTNEKCFEKFDPKTRAYDVWMTDQFADVSFPVIVERLLAQDLVPANILPIVCTFLQGLIPLLNIPIENETLHELNLSALNDGLSDMNLNMISSSDSHMYFNFYRNLFPKGRNDFIAEIEKLVNSTKPGIVEIPSGWTSAPHAGEDRKIEWEKKLVWFKSQMFPNEVAVNKVKLVEVLKSNDWLNEYEDYIKSQAPQILEHDFITLIQCKESVIGNRSPDSGKDEILFFTEQGICKLYEKQKHRVNSNMKFFNRSEIRSISVGTEIHEAHGGFVSNVSTFIVLTIFTSNHQIYTKHIYLGKNEAELNATRPGLMAKLREVSAFYDLEEGDVVESSSGFTITPSIGFWHSLD